MKQVCAALFLVLAGAFASAADNPVRFSGSVSGDTPVFETRGPWLLDWSASSDHPKMARLEMRLFDAATDEFLGTVTELEGTGSGLKLFEHPGSYRIRVISQGLTWSLEISHVDAKRAAEVKRASEGAATLEDSASIEARRVAADAFVSWRPVDDSTLLLFAEDNATGFRIGFNEPCSGLAEAKALSFVSAPGGFPERYDSIMLDNGTRCYFSRVVPSVFD